ncbi:hypothetical protein HK105_205882 [Polyrhizophydium stewartii]|uniref:F-box domain-containing protein n=1 Tax=Polyrhizophydium stewartii TaxID=2732419 RepID=A0ABR4N4R7_9FUNG
MDDPAPAQSSGPSEPPSGLAPALDGLGSEIERSKCALLADSGFFLENDIPPLPRDLPTELWELVFAELPPCTLALGAARVSRRWAAIAARSPVTVDVALVVGRDEGTQVAADARDESPTDLQLCAGSRTLARKLGKLASAHALLPALRGPASGGRLWAVVRADALIAELESVRATPTLSGSHAPHAADPDLAAAVLDIVCQQACDAAAQLTGRPPSRVRANPLLLVDLAGRGAEPGTVRTGAAEVAAAARLASMCTVFREVLVRNPDHDAVNVVASRPTAAVTHLELGDVHTQVACSAASKLPRLTSLRLQSDGRFLDEHGIFHISALRPISAMASQLTDLTLDGPWFQSMLDYGPGLFETIKQLKQLRRFIADLDAQVHTPQAIYDLFVALPHLVEFGRLGRIDHSFWRLFQRGEAARIRRVSLGSCKFAFSMRLSGNRNFLADMAFGLLWAMPMLEELSLYLGFQSGVDTDLLLDIVCRIKAGKDWNEPDPIDERRLPPPPPPPPSPAKQRSMAQAAVAAAYGSTRPRRTQSAASRAAAAAREAAKAAKEGKSSKQPTQPTVHGSLDAPIVSQEKAQESDQAIRSGPLPRCASEPVSMLCQPDDVGQAAPTTAGSSGSSGPPPQMLRRVYIFQAIDVESINATAWRNAALVHGGGPPISIVITDDVSIDGSLGRQFRTFGPPI